MDGKVKVIEPQYSINAHSHEAWDPDWIVYRFVATMKCNNERCGEIVVVGGEARLSEEENYDFEGEYRREYVNYLTPKIILPAPLIITFPEKTPDKVS